MEHIKDIYTAVKTDIKKGDTQSSFYNAILEAHLKHNPVHVTGARLNANGKIENELVLPSTLDKSCNSFIKSRIYSRTD
jgi:hypothetical protein